MIELFNEILCACGSEDEAVHACPCLLPDAAASAHHCAAISPTSPGPTVAIADPDSSVPIAHPIRTNATAESAPSAPPAPRDNRSTQEPPHLGSRRRASLPANEDAVRCRVRRVWGKSLRVGCHVPPPQGAHGFSPASDHLRLIVEVRLGCGLVFQRQAPADVLPNVSTGIAPIIGGKLGAEPVLIVEENGSGRPGRLERPAGRTNDRPAASSSARSV